MYDFLRNCLEMNPSHSTMWKDWLLFELGHLKSRDDEEKVKEISKLANESQAACNLDLHAYLKDMCGKEKKSRWGSVCVSDFTCIVEVEIRDEFDLSPYVCVTLCV